MRNNSKIEIRHTSITDDIHIIKKLWFDYLVWVNEEMQSLCGLNPHIPVETLKKDIDSIDKFQPPQGILLTAIYENKICGVGSFKKINTEICEIKRMYIDPKFRRLGAGRAILKALLIEARNMNYNRVRLDSPKFMNSAHSLYRSIGFQNIEAYTEMENPEKFKDYLLFMELDLRQAL